ncbi:MAG: HDIG domain-containing protein [Deltaproteobacteria bacterium]|nr:HDIG domain-containing protein [Deltaproteobacteria bacterium]
MSDTEQPFPGRARAWARRLLPLLTTLLVGLSGLSLVVLPRLLDPAFLENPEIGGYVEGDIRAPSSLDIIDQETSDWMMKDAAAQVRSVYDHDAQLPLDLELKLSEAFAFMRQPEPDTTPPTQAVFEARRADFFRILGTALEAEDFADLRAQRFDLEIEVRIIECLRAAYFDYVVADRQFLLPDLSRGITIRHFNVAAQPGAREFKEEVVTDLSELRDIAAARTDMASRLRDIEGLTRNQRRLMLSVADRLLKPNLIFNRDETERRKLAAADDVKPIVIPIQQGERIAKKGDRLTRRQVLILKGFVAQQQKTSGTSRAIGTTLLLAIFALATLRFSRSLSKRALSVRDGLFAIAVLVLQMLMVRGLNFALSFWEPSLPIPYEAFLWAAPFATGALLVRLFLAHEVGLVVGMVSAVAASLMFQGNLVLLLYVLSGTLVAATPTHKRNRWWQIGLEVALAQALVVTCNLILSERFFGQDWVWVVPAALVSGVSAAILCGLVTPLLETVLGFTTEGRLKELASLNHPLLKQLIVAAPGTYHHSIVMGQMVEAAAMDIGCNALLAKVGAYFHDIGKLGSPQLYVENRRGDVRGASASLLNEEEWKTMKSHATHGVRLARQARLGSAVIEIVGAHHGTRALERAPMPLRYDGPKPRSKEATLVMLADAVEARARDESALRLEQLQQIIDEATSEVFERGQLSESELALKDLPLCKAAFLRVLAKIRRAEDGQKLWVVHEALGRQERSAAARTARAEDADDDKARGDS